MPVGEANRKQSRSARETLDGGETRFHPSEIGREANRRPLTGVLDSPDPPRRSMRWESATCDRRHSQNLAPNVVFVAFWASGIRSLIRDTSCHWLRYLRILAISRRLQRWLVLSAKLSL